MSDDIRKELSVIDGVDIQMVASVMSKINEFQKLVQTKLRQNHDFGVIPGTPKPTLLKPGAEKILMLLGIRSEFDVIDSTRNFDKGFFQYQVKCRLYKGDMLITEGLGACNSQEPKYVKLNPFGVDNTVLKVAKKRALIDATLLVGSLSDIFVQDLDDVDLVGEKIMTDQRKVATDQDGTISKAQAKRIFAKADGDLDLVRKVLKEYGYEKSEQVEKVHYNEICDKIDAVVAQAVPDEKAAQDETAGG